MSKRALAVWGLLMAMAVSSVDARALQPWEKLCPVCGSAVDDGAFGAEGEGSEPALRGELFGRGRRWTCPEPMTCPRCRYTGFLGDFGDGRGQGPEIPEAVRKAILEGKVLVPWETVAEGTISSLLPLRVRQDLLVQTRRLLGADAVEIGGLAMTGCLMARESGPLRRRMPRKLVENFCAWSEEVFGEGRQRLPGGIRTAVLYLLVGERLGERRDRAMAALGAMVVAAETGEHLLAEALCERLEKLIGKEETEGLSAGLFECYAREGHFADLALEAFDSVVLDEGVELRERIRIVFTILELRRRLGDVRALETAVELRRLVRELGEGAEKIEDLVHRSISLTRLCVRKKNRTYTRFWKNVESAFPKVRTEEGKKTVQMKFLAFPFLSVLKRAGKARWRRGEDLVRAYVDALQPPPRGRKKEEDLRLLADRLMPGRPVEAPVARAVPDGQRPGWFR